MYINMTRLVRFIPIKRVVSIPFNNEV
jgi:hypothetical protein